MRRGDNDNLVKDVGTPWDLYHNWQWSSVLSGVNCVLMGHNRWATVGGITRHTAHPFEFDKLVGAHNGTLKRRNLLDDSRMFEVDSENLYYHMNNNGLEDTLSKTDGAFALTWFNKEDNTLNFIRNAERELYYVVSECGVLFWASEEWMLIVALSKNNIEHGKAVMFSERNHYCMEINRNFGVNKVIGEFNVSNKAAFKPEPTYQKNTGYQTTRIGGTTTKTVTKTSGSPDSGGKFVNKHVEVHLCSFIKESEHNSYFVGKVIGGTNDFVRIFAGVNHPEYKRLSMLLDETLEAVHLKSYRSWGNNSYYVCDIRTTNVVKKKSSITYLPCARKEEVKRRIKDREHFDCAWCSSPITEDEVDTSLILEGDDGVQVVCSHCKNLEEVKDYVNHD